MTTPTEFPTYNIRLPRIFADQLELVGELNTRFIVAKTSQTVTVILDEDTIEELIDVSHSMGWIRPSARISKEQMRVRKSSRRAYETLMKVFIGYVKLGS